MLRKSDSRSSAAAKASSPHGYSPTGFAACWRSFGLDSAAKTVHRSLSDTLQQARRYPEQMLRTVLRTPLRRPGAFATPPPHRAGRTSFACGRALCFATPVPAADGRSSWTARAARRRSSRSSTWVRMPGRGTVSRLPSTPRVVRERLVRGGPRRRARGPPGSRRRRQPRSHGGGPGLGVDTCPRAVCGRSPTPAAGGSPRGPDGRSGTIWGNGTPPLRRPRPPRGPVPDPQMTAWTPRRMDAAASGPAHRTDPGERGHAP
jgi:hypothetical protein